jgi:DNA-binding transcriptional MocR family regulator
MALDEKAPTVVSLIDLVIAAIRDDIQSRALMPGARLPSIRDLARRQRISRHTVVSAYDRLIAMGHIESRPGSGFYVTARRGGALNVAGVDQQKRVYDVAWLVRQALEDGTDIVKVGGPWLPDEWLDREAIQREMRGLGREPGTHVLHYGHPLGYEPLRRQLTLKLAELGITAPPQQIVLTHGTSQALALATRLLLQPGDTALVDDPGYYNLFGFLRQNGIRLVGVPRTVDGPDVSTLRKLLEEHRPKVFFTQSLMQNPTGTDMSPVVMHRVLAAAQEFDFIIVEDDTYSDLEAMPGARLATLDGLDRVIYVRSFSKTISGSIRVGFAAASPPIIDALANLKVLESITTSQFNEKLIYRLLIAGGYRKYLEHLRTRIGRARGAALRLFAAAGMPVFTTPANGNFVWARFADSEDSATLVAPARRASIMLAAGAVFRPNLEASAYLRFNVAMCDDPRFIRYLAAQTGTTSESLLAAAGGN